MYNFSIFSVKYDFIIADNNVVKVLDIFKLNPDNDLKI